MSATQTAVLPPVATDDAPDELALQQESKLILEQANKVSIKTAEDYQQAIEIGKSVKGLKQRIVEFFAPNKKRWYDGWQASIKQETKYVAPLDQAEQQIKRGVTEYLNEQERIRRAEEDRIRALAAKEEEDRRVNEAAELERQGRNEEAVQVLDSAPLLPPVVVVPRSVPKVAGVANKTTWKFRIKDPNKIPRVYLMVDEQKIGQIVKAMKNLTDIPGIEVYAEQGIALKV